MSKKFAYSVGDEADTDDFISKALSGAPKVEPMDTSGQFSARDGSYYQVDTGSRVIYSNRCARIIVMIWAGVLAIVGLALAITGGVEKSQGLLPVCPNCDQVVIMLISVGCVMLLFGIIGFYAAYSRNSCITAVFGIVLLLLCVVFLALGIVIIVFSGGDKLDGVWKSSVQNDVDAICKVQNKLSCSGYKKCCYIVSNSSSDVNATTTTMAPTMAPTAAPTAAPTPAPNAASATTTSAAAATTTSVSAAPPPLFDLHQGGVLGDAATTAAAPTSSPAAVSGCTMIVQGSADAAALADFCVPSCYSNAPPCEPKLRDEIKKIFLPGAGIFMGIGVLNILVAWAAKRMLTTDM